MADLHERQIEMTNSIKRHIMEEILINNEIIDFLTSVCKQKGGVIDGFCSPTKTKGKNIIMVYTENGDLWISNDKGEDFLAMESTEDLFALFNTIVQILPKN